jgi:Zn finger protein HypA/HybF involved in hydrogenase expression
MNIRTVYIIDRRIFVGGAKEDPAKAASRITSAWQAAEQAVDHHIERQPELGLASGFLICNPDLTLVDEKIASVDNLLMSGLFEKDRAAVIYSVTCRVSKQHHPIAEPRVDMLQKDRTWKMAHSISMALGEFVQAHGDQNDAERPLLHRVATDLGRCRLVHSSNLQKTFDNLAKGSLTATEEIIFNQLQGIIDSQSTTPTTRLQGSKR